MSECQCQLLTFDSILKGQTIPWIYRQRSFVRRSTNYYFLMHKTDSINHTWNETLNWLLQSHVESPHRYSETQILQAERDSEFGLAAAADFTNQTKKGCLVWMIRVETGILCTVDLLFLETPAHIDVAISLAKRFPISFSWNCPCELNQNLPEFVKKEEGPAGTMKMFAKIQ